MITTQPIALDRADLKAITPAQVEYYMECKGWIRKETRGWGQYWEHSAEGSECFVEIRDSPLASSFHGYYVDVAMSLTKHSLGDYDKRMAELMIALGVYEGRLAGEVLKAIKNIDHEKVYPAWIASMAQRGLSIEDE